MVFLLNVFVGLMLVVIQSTVVPRLPVIENCYDFLLPFIIYQSLFRPPRETVPLVVGLGLLMDQLSGAPTGLFAIVYFWVFVSLRWGQRFLHMGNYYLVPCAVAVAVLLENGFFALAYLVSSYEPAYFSVAGKMIVGQVGWALLSAPVFMMLLNAIHHGWAAWLGSLNTDNGDASP